MAAAKSIAPEPLVALGAPALAAALIEHAENDPILRKKLRMLLAGTEGPGKLAAELGKRIQTIGRSRSFVDWDKRRPLVQELDHIKTTIGTTLAAQNDAAAIERMWDFIGIADRVLERAGDGIGEVEDIFGEAMVDLGRLIAADPNRDTMSIARRVLAMCDGGLCCKLLSRPHEDLDWHVVFWEITDLVQLADKDRVPITALTAEGQKKPLMMGFVPKGPMLVKAPLL